MRIIQRVLHYLMSVGLLVVGALLVVYPSSELYRLAIDQLPHGQYALMRYALACVVLAVGVFSLLPFEYFAHKRRSISFPAEKGRTVIELQWFEAALRKTFAQLPIVKRADIVVTPVEKDSKVEVLIKAAIVKSEEESTRDASDRLQKFADEAARSILGPNEVKTVEVQVTSVKVDPKKAAKAFDKYPPAPVERTATIVAPAVAAAAPVAAAAASSTFAQDDELDQDDYEVVEEEPEHTEASVPAHSDELLTYDEAASLESPAEIHTDEPAADRVTDNLSADNEPAAPTSFEAINEEPDEKTPNRDHE